MKNTNDVEDLRTSETWWADIKTHRVAFEAWLHDQYRGEVTAAARIEALRDAFAEPGTHAARVLTSIADQERTHARWIAELLVARGLAPGRLDAEERYWKQTLPAVVDLETGAAIGAHAENMRLERIEAIAGDDAAEPDVRAVFRRILPQERFHARAFRSLTTAAAMEKTARAHELGRRVLGLAP